MTTRSTFAAVSRRAASAIFLIALACAARAELRVVADFEGGNAEVVSIDDASRTVRIMPAIREGRGWPCWWFLRVEGLAAGQELTLEVQAQTKPYRGKSVLAAAWCQPKHAWFSHDGNAWKQSARATFTPEKIAVYKITADSSKLSLAWGRPFLPSDAEKLLADIAAKIPDAHRFELAKTRGGRSVPAIRIGAPDAPRQVWVNARQHAWESGGSWVARGFIEWFAGDEPAARELRAGTCLHFVPIMDVDNVALGAGGKDAEPRDHNRDWAVTPHYPEVAAAQRMIREIHARRGLDVFLDLHNPGADDPVFFFGPFGFDSMTGARKRNYSRWLELASTQILEPLKVQPRFKFANYVQTEEERARMSSSWAFANTGETTVSLCLETAWNSVIFTTEGYAKVGASLARTLAAHLKENPRRPVAE